jgi:Animal haem peroxidase
MSETQSLFSDLLDKLGEELRWYQLPKVLGLIALLRLRDELRDKNLFDTEDPPLEKIPDPDSAPQEVVKYRSYDGTYNDLQYPRMGAAGARFGRNFPLDKVHPDAPRLMDPSPRLISRRLLTRDSFQPVDYLNLTATAWVQFMVHDWVAHKQGEPADSHEIPLEEGDPWPDKAMRVPRTPSEPPSHGGPPTYRNVNSHWWDASQIYGNDQATAAKLRAGFDGKMKMGDTALLPLDVNGVELTGFADNWWIGLSMLHALFVSEHNAICDRLKLEYAGWSDERLFQQARLVNSALLAKIHTVEWTPAMLPHPTVAEALRINWAGVAGEDLQRVFKFLDDSDILGGIVGTKPYHHSAPFSLTEEFVAIYRMHPLIPDDFTFYSLETGRLIGTHTLPEVSLGNTRHIMEAYRLRDLFYSFGLAHPGALRLHNYPKHLQFMTRGDGTTIDLAAIDVLRDRERGIPRYNDFREMLYLERITTFEELCDNPQWAQELKEVYGGDVDKVDLMVGAYAEPLIEGFGFSETAFQIAIVMASRRLKSDRFLTSSFNEEVYTEIGLKWIRDNSMITVLLRHHPALEPALRGLDNAFNPWNRIAPAIVN